MTDKLNNDPLWTGAALVEATGGRLIGDWSVGGVSIDSRDLVPGDLFIALTDRRDGHDFVAAALAAGAAGAMVARRPANVPKDAPLLIVDDVQTALEALGQAGRARIKGKVMAITGSVGKTSSKEMARLVLARAGKVHASEASYNNQWGVPLTLARMPADTDFVVIEIGMSHPGETAPLARQARPDLALITTIAPAHLEAFPDGLEGIAHEKAAIFEGLGPDGIAVIPKGLVVSPILQRAADSRAARVIGFGPQLRTDYMLGQIGGQALEFSLPGANTAMAQNALGVLAATMALGVSAVDATQALLDWRPAPGRGAVEDMGGITIIDDAYNANPASMAAGLDMLAKSEAQGRRIAIFGDMLELGPEAEAMHAALAEDPAMVRVDLVHAAGPLMRALIHALPAEKRGIWAENADDLAALLPDLAETGDIVLIKGSKSSRIASLVDAFREAAQMAGKNKGDK